MLLYSLDQPLPTSKYKSFFSLLKTVFDPLNDKKAELAKVKKSRPFLDYGAAKVFDFID